MVKVIVGDLFASKAQTLVNTVNCVGVMGKGVALAFKRRFPEMYEDYVARCKRHEVRLGEPYLFRQLLEPNVLNFPTKGHWRSVTKLEDIAAGLEYLIDHYQEWGITSLAVPPLGCGNGQLEWRVVGPTLYRYLSEIDVPVELYAPYETPHEELQRTFLEGGPESAAGMPEPQWIPAEWVVVAEIVKRIEDQPYHHAIGRTIFQKIVFVATEQGLPTGFEFTRGSYGPYAGNLKGMESRLVNNGIIETRSLGQMQQITIGPTFEAAQRAYRDSIRQWEQVIERTVDLFIRLDSSTAELVASTLMVAGELSATGTVPSERMVFDAVLDWKQRRRPRIDEKLLAETIRALADLDWLAVERSTDLPLSPFEQVYA